MSPPGVTSTRGTVSFPAMGHKGKGWGHPPLLQHMTPEALPHGGQGAAGSHARAHFRPRLPGRAQVGGRRDSMVRGALPERSLLLAAGEPASGEITGGWSLCPTERDTWALGPTTGSGVEGTVTRLTGTGGKAADGSMDLAPAGQGTASGGKWRAQCPDPLHPTPPQGP